MARWESIFLLLTCVVASVRSKATAYIVSVRPDRGPEAGGTELKITTIGLTGKVTEIRAAGVKCANISQRLDEVGCKTGRSVKTGTGVIKITFTQKDSTVQRIVSSRFVSGQTFSYLEDPEVYADQLRRPLGAIQGGGIMIYVPGNHLYSVATPNSIISIKGSNVHYQSECKVLASTRMVCLTPKISSRKLEGTFYFGVLLDGITKYRQLALITVYKNPVYYKFSGKENLKNVTSGKRELEIQGEHLSSGCTIEDVRVDIGSRVCDVTELAADHLHCNLPSATMTGNASVTVGVGRRSFSDNRTSLRFMVGYIQYQPVSNEFISTIGSWLFGLIFLAIIIAMIYGFVKCAMRILNKPRSQQVFSPVAVSNPGSPGQHPGTATAAWQTESRGRYPQRYTPAPQPRGLLQVMLEPFLSSVTQPSQQASTTPEHGYLPMGNTTANAHPVQSPLAAQPAPQHQRAASAPPSGFLDSIDDHLKFRVEDCILDAKRISLGRQIGKGHFGQVFIGSLLKERSKETVEVAVKTLQGNVSHDEMVSFLEEALIMKDFSHANVLRLHGVVIKFEKPYVVLPYMANGDLREYIRNVSGDISLSTMLEMAFQVAKGMEYLAIKRFVHRDLAARNCVVSRDCTVKIADFGLTRDIYDKDYYRMSDRTKPVPAKWMALESLVEGHYSTKSDVWSFGVVMWEILTRGAEPYPDIINYDVKDYISRGRRLTKPKYAPDAVYDLMSACWLENKDARPDFSEIVTTLSVLLAKIEKAQHMAQTAAHKDA